MSDTLEIQFRQARGVVLGLADKVQPVNGAAEKALHQALHLIVVAEAAMFPAGETARRHGLTDREFLAEAKADLDAARVRMLEEVTR